MHREKCEYLRSWELGFKRRHDGWIRGPHHGYRFRWTEIDRRKESGMGSSSAI